MDSDSMARIIHKTLFQILAFFFFFAITNDPTVNILVEVVWVDSLSGVDSSKWSQQVSSSFV